uniref:PH domain-containing protein n=1 Tax=Scleropages formosus TaxID=113540 RepID=A0A8C9S2D6_SCLFO
MTEQDRVSQASSLATISSFPVRHKAGDCKVQNFGKRSRAVKRDPNCPVVIRGWLYKQDGSGLKLWKRRWFVLSDFCLFYYKDSREESVLGSIPLPSYKILFCTPRECKNRKYAFKAVHQGMRSYFFSADTQEDMLGWVRALSQSACMELESSLNRRCSSYHDFTQIGGSSESLSLCQATFMKNCPALAGVQGTETLNEASHPERGRDGTPRLEQKGKHKALRHSPSPKTSTPTTSGVQRRRGQSLNQDGNELDSLPFYSSGQTPPPSLKSTGSRPLTPRGQLGSRPHTPVGRVDIRPQDEPQLSSLGSSPPSPIWDFTSSLTPTVEKKYMHGKSASNSSSPFHIPVVRRPAGKANSNVGQAGLLPPLPPPRITTAPTPHHQHHHHRHHHHRSPMSVCVLQPAMNTDSDLYQEREQPSVRPLESDVDTMLTRLCGCDKLLQALSVELAQLQAEKDNVQCALEMTRLHLEDWKGQGTRGLCSKRNEVLSQKVLLQEELVTVRARLCDVSMEMERVWSQYERLESELSIFHSHLQHICRFGRPQEQAQAQRELWMMEDILCGLKANRSNFQLILGSQRQTVPSPVLQKPVLHADSVLGPQPDRSPKGASAVFYNDLSSHPRSLDRSGHSLSVLPGKIQQTEVMPAPVTGLTASCWSTPDPTAKRARMSKEEQVERMKRNQERLSGQKKASMASHTSHMQRGGSSPPAEESPFPLRVTRVVTAILPSTLVARRVSVEDPPPELATPFPEQIFPEAPLSLTDHNKKHLNKLRERLAEKTDQNSNWPQEEPAKNFPDGKLRRDLSEDVSEKKSSLLLKANRHKRGVKDGASSHLLSHEQLYTLYTPTEVHPEDALTERSKSELVAGFRSDACEQEGSGSDLHAGAEGASVPSGNMRREKVGPQASLPAPDAEHDLCLTREQREAKLKRVERIRERVAKSAARENNAQPFCQRTGGNREGRLNLSLPLVNEDSKKNKEITGTDEECQYTDGLDCGSSCHSDRDPDLSLSVTTEPKPSRIPFHDGRSRGRAKKSDFDVKYCGKTPIDSHSHLSEDTTTQSKRFAQKKLTASRHHITKLAVFPTDGSLEKAEHYSSRNIKCETKEKGVNSASRFNKKRTEWFLSANQRVEFIPLANQNVESVSNENNTNQDLRNKGSDLLCEHPAMNSKIMEFALSPFNQNLPDVSDTNGKAISLNCPKQKKATPEDSSTSLTLSDENLAHDDQSLVTTEKLTSEIKSEENASIVIDESAASLNKKYLQQSKHEVMSQIEVTSAERQKNHKCDETEGCNLTSNMNGTHPELLTDQTITTYATVQFISPSSTGSIQNDESNTHFTLDDSIHEDNSAKTSQDLRLVTKPLKVAHIYEEITYNSASLDSKSSSSQDTVLTVNDFASQLGHEEGLGGNLNVRSVSTNQSNETETEKEKSAADWSDGNKLANQEQADSEALKGGLRGSEESKRTQLRKDVCSPDVGDNHGSQFPKARVTVVRTSL